MDPRSKISASLLTTWLGIHFLQHGSSEYLGRSIDSDSPDYAQFYDELDAEYAQELYKTTTTADTASQDSEKQEISETGNVNEPSESYADAKSRLVCDNPWFWNTFKCVWLDVWAKKTTKQTQKNAKTAGITIGIISLFTVLPLCWLCVVALYFRSKVNTYAKLMDQYMTEYMPGSIILPNGEVKYYDPTPEEEEAFEDLIHVITSVV